MKQEPKKKPQSTGDDVAVVEPDQELFDAPDPLDEEDDLDEDVIDEEEEDD